MQKVDNKLSWQSIKQPVTPGGSWGRRRGRVADAPESPDGTPKTTAMSRLEGKERGFFP